MKELRLLILGLLATLLTSCSLDDDRDDCSIKLHFRYIVNSEDRFSKEINSMRHFIFGEDSIFVKEFYNPCDISNTVRVIDLKKGKYKVVTIGNITGLTLLSELVPGRTKLKEFTQGIHAATTRTEEYHTNGDQLFYNVRDVEVSTDAPSEYICDMSNIHCHLHILATFEYTPKYADNYNIRLFEVPASYSLSPDSTRRILLQYDDEQLLVPTADNHVLLFPIRPKELTTHMVDIIPYNYELEAEFITERYTDQWVPILQVFNGDTPITNKVNLDRAFTYFGWYPDRTPVQEYWIRLYMYRDGRVELDRWMRGRVAGWIDGGTITN